MNATVSDRSRLLKAFDVLGVVIALSVVAAWMYGMQVRNWYRAKATLKATPVVSLVPHPLADTASVSVKGTTLTEFGYQIVVPWERIEGRKSGSQLAAYVFAGGRGLTFLNPSTLHDIIQFARNASEQTHTGFADFLGARTGYDLLSSILNTTPEQLRPFMQKSESYRRTILLNLKGAELVRNPSTIHSFSTGNLRGFQFGDPATDHLVEVKAFDPADQEFQFFFAVDRRSNVRLQQAEINQILQTLHPVSASSN